MIQESMDFNSKPKTAQELVYEFLQNHPQVYFTGFEIANYLNADGYLLTEGSASKYLRNLRKLLSFRSRERDIGKKPFTEWSFVEAKTQQEV